MGRGKKKLKFKEPQYEVEAIRKRVLWAVSNTRKRLRWNDEKMIQANWRD